MITKSFNELAVLSPIILILFFGGVYTICCAAITVGSPAWIPAKTDWAVKRW